MPFNGVGVFERIYQWVQDAANGIFVDATRTDTDSNDIAAGLTNCVTRDGQSPWTADLPAGGFKVTGMAQGANPNDSVNYDQVFNSPAFVTPTATTSPTNSDDPLRLVTVQLLNDTAMDAALPNQQLGFLRSNGTSSAFTQTHTGYAQKEVRGADIASAATINLTTATGNFCHLTGTTPVTGITIDSGASYELYADDAVPLTHSASLNLPGAVNYTTSAGDRLHIRGDTTGAVVSINSAGGYAVAPYPYMKVSDRKASGTSGGNSTPTTISQTRTLNTIESNTIVGASLASDTITLPPGTYKVSGTAQTFNTNANKAFFYNATDGTYAIVGISSFSGSNAASDALLEGYFTITSTKNFTVRHYTVTNGGAANSLGVSTSSGQVEVYTQVVIEKVG